MEEATAAIASSILPISGLRRNPMGDLTEDAIKIIIDGLKSRGINPSDPAEKKRILKELITLLCMVKRQYDFLLNELGKKIDQGAPIEKEFVEMIAKKNMFLQDVLAVASYIDTLHSSNKDALIEGWQNTISAEDAAADINNSPPAARKLIEKFQADMQMLNSGSYTEMRKYKMEMTREKNRAASMNLGVYGFLNLVAVGLLIYIAGSN